MLNLDTYMSVDIIYDTVFDVATLEILYASIIFVWS